MISKPAMSAAPVDRFGTPVMGMNCWGVVHRGPVPCARWESLEDQYTK